MLRAVLLSQWRESRLAVVVLAAAAFGTPFLSTWGDPPGSDPLGYFHLMTRVWQWGTVYPLIALAAALVIGLGVWRPDRRKGHVYALTLPVPRPRYLLLRYACGALLLLPVAGALLLGAVAVTAPLQLPPLLHAYPAGLTSRFLLAAGVAYTLFFAAGGLTPRVARVLVAGFLVLFILTAAADALGFAWKPLPVVLDAVFAPAGPLGVFRGRWMLIDA